MELKVFIDAGHQGPIRATWPPARGPHEDAHPDIGDTSLEADENTIVKNVAMRLNSAIRSIAPKSYCRPFVFESLSARAQRCFEQGCNIAVLLHANSAGDKESPTQGLIAFHDGAIGAKFAHYIHGARPIWMKGSVVKPVDVQTTSWASRALNVLSPYTQKGIPAVLVELGFVSNITERKRLMSDICAQQYASIINTALIEYIYQEQK